MFNSICCFCCLILKIVNRGRLSSPLHLIFVKFKTFLQKDDAGSFDAWRGNRILTAIYYVSPTES